jgi:hypothetical protein
VKASSEAGREVDPTAPDAHMPPPRPSPGLDSVEREDVRAMLAWWRHAEGCRREPPPPAPGGRGPEMEGRGGASPAAEFHLGTVVRVAGIDGLFRVERVTSDGRFAWCSDWPYNGSLPGKFAVADLELLPARPPIPADACTDDDGGIES